MEPVEKTAPLNGLLKVKLAKISHVLYPQPPAGRSDDELTRPPPPYAIIDFDKSQVCCHAFYPGPHEPAVWALDGNRLTNGSAHTFDVTRQAELHIWLYQPADDSRDTNSDSFLGKTSFRPALIEKGTKSKEEWLDLHGGKGSISIMTKFIATKPLTITTEYPRGFELQFSSKTSMSALAPVSIYLKLDTQMHYAGNVFQESKLDNMAVRPNATQFDSPFVIPLKFDIEVPTKDISSAPGRQHFFFCVSLYHYNLFSHLMRKGPLDLAEARFYAAQILCAIDYLHERDIVLGKLSTKRIWIDSTGYLFIGDFDLFFRDISGSRLPWPQSSWEEAWHLRETSDAAKDHIAPEILRSQSHPSQIHASVDWWSFGIILHEMLVATVTFDLTDYAPADTTLELQSSFNGISVGETAKDFIMKLLSPDPLQRLGANGAAEIKSHPFFNGIDWPKLMRKEYIPKLRPPLPKKQDQAWASSSSPTPELSEEFKAQFAGWSYNRPEKQGT
ncbi:serine/threonine protein kinase-like protein [Penicillium cinerascens]|uniref:non-specific serine/threonine protein kinase n=1 Tax=Penicillium cinerascens TaxID=70096 RepID=A0A9W9J8J7_9EURO|nr:serine/threonine protein kinase-like protein [Penicillium cinerascens]KAJ5191241.1 serine/threonine protein kinase-like protein [Penicillium cinerascens]